MQQTWVTLLGTALAAIAFQSSAVRAQDRTYSIEGYQLSEHSVGVIRRADDQKNRGIDALGRGAWASAQRDCAAAIAGYSSTGLPSSGRAASVYREAYACVADAEMKLGNLDDACDRYRDISYYTLMDRSPREMCEARSAAVEARFQAWDDYADTFARFSSQTGQLQSFTEGSAARAQAASDLAATCASLNSFGREVEGARAATGYCSAIVKFEAGDFPGACALLATARSDLSRLDRSLLAPERSRHVQALATTIEGFRPTCSNTGSAW